MLCKLLQYLGFEQGASKTVEYEPTNVVHFIPLFIHYGR
jgi:hypothetical protein